MFLAEKTVKNYVSSILAKLGLERRTQAAVLASKLLSPDSPPTAERRSGPSAARPASGADASPCGSARRQLEVTAEQRVPGRRALRSPLSVPVVRRARPRRRGR